MSKPANLFEQLTEDGEHSNTAALNISLVAELVGLHYDPNNGATFRNALRDTPAIDEAGFTMGRAAVAFLKQRVKWLESVRAA